MASPLSSALRSGHLAILHTGRAQSPGATVRSLVFLLRPQGARSLPGAPHAQRASRWSPLRLLHRPEGGRAAWLAALLLALVCPTQAQDRPKPPPDPIPPDIVLADLREAYSTAPTAEEVTFRLRSPSGDRADTFTIRIDPGPPPASHPRALLLELNQLRIHFADGKLTAINTAAPDKFYQRAYSGPITSGRLAELLPPLPLPHLAILNADDPRFSSPLQYLRDITWEPGLVDESARPLTLTMKGSGPSGSITITALVSTVRLTKIAAAIRRNDSEAQLELSFRPTDPGDPAGWSIPLEGRQPVPSLTDLRTTPKPLGSAAPNEPVPNLNLSRFDMTGWILHEAIDAARPSSLAVLLFKQPADATRAQSIQRDAQNALAALRQVHAESTSPATPSTTPPPRFISAAAVILELGQFSRDRWHQLRITWESSRGKAPPIPADDLMWSPGALESIDRFSPGADSILLIIRPDQTLAASIKLESKTSSDIATDLRKALMP